jgi:hypothetical protein
LITRSAGAVELWAKEPTVAVTENKKAHAIIDTGANRGIEALIRGYLLKKEAKWNATIVACC